MGNRDWSCAFRGPKMQIAGLGDQQRIEIAYAISKIGIAYAIKACISQQARVRRSQNCSIARILLLIECVDLERLGNVTIRVQAVGFFDVIFADRKW